MLEGKLQFDLRGLRSETASAVVVVAAAVVIGAIIPLVAVVVSAVAVVAVVMALAGVIEDVVGGGRGVDARRSAVTSAPITDSEVDSS